MKSIALALLGLALMLSGSASAQQTAKPNIVVLWGDDVGMWNIGAYTHGMTGRTQSIDRIAREGILFTDHYGQPSCTAGRAAFIMGQMPIRIGEKAVGIPGSTRGIQKEDPTLAKVLKSQGMFWPDGGYAQGADTLSMKKAVEDAMQKVESANRSSN